MKRRKKPYLEYWLKVEDYQEEILDLEIMVGNHFDEDYEVGIRLIYIPLVYHQVEMTHFFQLVANQ